jgi:hypothetical protein
MARRKTSAIAGGIGKIAGQSYKVVPIGSVSEHPKNPRKGDVGLIGDSIVKNDFYGAVIVQKSTKQILAGNHRWKAARARGLTTLPVIFVDVDDATALRILLADNRTSDEATYDDAILLELLQQANLASGLEGTGYDGADLAKLLADSQPPVPDIPTAPTHGDQTKMVHTCPRCSYEWAARAEKKSTVREVDASV